jgi:DNA-binding protein HU-beta
MNKAQLIDAVAMKLEISRRAAGDAVDAVLGGITGAVIDGDKVSLTGFGTFEQVHRPARTARNPRTGDAVKVAAATVPKFRAGQAFKDEVNGSKGKKPAAKKTLAKKAATPAKKAAMPMKKAVMPAKKAMPAKKTAVVAKKTMPAKKTAVVAKKTTAVKAVAKKAAPAKKAATNASAAKKTAAAARPVAKKSAAKAPATKTAAKKTVAKKTAPAKRR